MGVKEVVHFLVGAVTNLNVDLVECTLDLERIFADEGDYYGADGVVFLSVTRCWWRCLDLVSWVTISLKSCLDVSKFLLQAALITDGVGSSDESVAD